MIDIYQCRLGLYHDKPCKPSYTDKDGVVYEPRSNNGWIYTAYANRLLIMRPSNRIKLHDTFADCRLRAAYSNVYFLDRLPGKELPPMSRDEIIGMISLGFNPLRYGWFMYKMNHEPNYFEAIKALWKIRKEHRNTFWEKGIIEAYPIAMKLWWHDRHYILKGLGMKSNWFYFLMFQLYAAMTIVQNNISAKNVLWLQLSDLKTQSATSRFWLKLINQKKNFMEYFGKNHPFNNIEECL